MRGRIDVPVALYMEWRYIRFWVGNEDGREM